MPTETKRRAKSAKPSKTLKFTKPKSAKPAKTELPELLRWFQAAIVAPSESPRRRPPSAREIDSRITRSKSLSAKDRLGVYAYAYFARLHECLVADFPAVRHLLGHEAFEKLARRYLTVHPSRHPSLNELGRDLPAYLETCPGRIPRRALVRDVALLERVMAVVFDAPEATGMTPADFAAFPRDQFAAAVFHFIPAFQLLAFEHPANAIATAVRQEKPLPPLGKKPTWVAVYRKDFGVWRKDLNEVEFTLLFALVAGKPLMKALDACERAFPDIDLGPDVARILGDWPNEGVIERLEVPAKRKKN